ncbi:MAG: hypothetical protein WD557_05140 [Dehalococcoidia bacterium]
MRRRPLLFVLVGVIAVLVAVPVASAAINRGSGAPTESRVSSLVALGSGFTYQGRLTDASAPANGAYDLRFILFDADSGGAQVGATVEKADVAVQSGLFTTELDFGAPSFDGNARWLEIAIRPGNQTGTYTVLSPRQPITPVPYALYAKTAGLALPFLGTGTSAADTGLINITQSGAGAAIRGTANLGGVGGNLSGSTGLVVAGTTFAINATGNVQVDGEITKDFGTNQFANAGPIAYATIANDGDVESGTANVTSAWVEAEDRYEITIAGEDATATGYVVNVTPQAKVVALWGAEDDVFFVQLIPSEEDADFPVQGAFSIVVYQP